MEHDFVADSPGPPKRRLYIYQQPEEGPPNSIRGWGFVVEDIDENGQQHPLYDSWERTFEEILRYPPDYAPCDIQWRWAADGEPIDLYAQNL